MKSNVILYSGKLCGDCQLLKAFMEAHGVAYENRDIQEQSGYSEELATKTAKLGVPYLVIDGEWVCGYQPGQQFSEDFARQLLGLA
jgi:glutaredoxin